jgi:hypothetical protein
MQKEIYNHMNLIITTYNEEIAKLKEEIATLKKKKVTPKKVTLKKVIEKK